MARKYTHLFFDLDNTLWDFDQNSIHAMQKTFAHFSLEKKGVSFGMFYQVYSKYNSRLWSQYRDGKVVKKELKRLRFRQTFDELNITGIDPLKMNLFYLAEMPFQTNLVKGALELLEFLKTRGYFLFIITNGFREVQRLKLKEAKLDKYFSKVYISEDVKATKPSAKIFEYAIKSSNAKKNASLMIGDDFQTDIVGALQFGIDAAWLTNLSAEEQIMGPENSHYSNFYSIKCLNDLIPIL